MQSEKPAGNYREYFHRQHPCVLLLKLLHECPAKGNLILISALMCDLHHIIISFINQVLGRFHQGNRTKNELIFLLSDSLMKDVIYSSSPKKAQKSPFSLLTFF